MEERIIEIVAWELSKKGFEVGGPSLKDPVAWEYLVIDMNVISQIGLVSDLFHSNQNILSELWLRSRKPCSCFQALKALR